MGCDIHAMIERRAFWVSGPDKTPEFKPWWINCGDPDLDRDYQLFGVLAGVRDRDVPMISSPRGMPEDACSAMRAWNEGFGGHSASYVTLAELDTADLRGVDPFTKKTIRRLVREMRKHMKGMPTIEGIGNRQVADETMVRLVFFFDS